MKFYADKNRTERELEAGDWVFIKLYPYRQISVAVRKSLKLAAKFYGPYQIVKKISTMAYELQLPPHSKIYTTLGRTYCYFVLKNGEERQCNC